jgi:hypothetical protein
VAEFGADDLSGSTFDWTDLSGSTFRAASLSDVTIRGTDLHRVRMRGVELYDVDITGDVQGLRINGIDVTDHLAEQMRLRHPDLALMRPDDPAGFRSAWTLLESQWDGTVERARRLPPERLHERVDDEWSFVETLRHLSFATAAWVLRAVEGDPTPWHPLDLPWDEAPSGRGFPRDLDARPPLEEVLELRASRQAAVRRVLDGLTDDALAAEVTPPDDGSWPPARTFPVKECLSIVLNEEYWHRQYAERDLAVLEGDATTPVDD